MSKHRNCNILRHIFKSLIILYIININSIEGLRSSRLYSRLLDLDSTPNENLQPAGVISRHIKNTFKPSSYFKKKPNKLKNSFGTTKFPSTTLQTPIRDYQQLNVVTETAKQIDLSALNSYSPILRDLEVALSNDSKLEDLWQRVNNRQINGLEDVALQLLPGKLETI